MNIALITAKGNNALKNKNLIQVEGKPFLQWQIEAALDSETISHVFVSSECDDIIQFCQGFEVKIINRPAELSRPDSNHGDVISHGVNHILRKYPRTQNVTVLLGNTAMVLPEDIDQSIELLKKDDLATGSMSVWKAQDDHPLRAMKQVSGYLESYRPNLAIDTNRQSYEDIYFYDQGPWTFRVENILHGNKKGPGPWWWMGEKCLFYEREWVTGRDIHTKFDIQVTEWWLQNYRKKQ